MGLNNLALPADRPLPESPATPLLEVPESADDVQVEPIAMHVPPECFYVRFGSFANFLWLQDTLAKWGGDCQNLIAPARPGPRPEQPHRKAVGPEAKRTIAYAWRHCNRRRGHRWHRHVLSGRGVVWPCFSKPATTLPSPPASVSNGRSGFPPPGATESKVTIGGRQVSYLSSPDGRVRSYYVTDGDFHFVASSKKLIERFLAIGKSGDEALGKLAEFRHARSGMPLKRGDNDMAVYFGRLFPQSDRPPLSRRNGPTPASGGRHSIG